VSPSRRWIRGYGLGLTARLIYPNNLLLLADPFDSLAGVAEVDRGRRVGPESLISKGFADQEWGCEEISVQSSLYIQAISPEHTLSVGSNASVFDFPT
jgi:hypothetical protein